MRFGAAIIATLVIALGGNAQTRKAFAARRGDSVPAALSDEDAAALRSGGVRSWTSPGVPHAPFAALDLNGNLTIAVPLLAPAGEYSVQVSFGSRTALFDVNVTAATPLAGGAGTPVIFLNGFQTFLSNPTQFSNCPVSPSDGSSPFGTLPSSLTQPHLFFDNCKECPNCPIEQLGMMLGQVIDSLQLPDGTPATTVDVVAHSMGGLIVRAYLTGKQTPSGQFQPPSDPKVRKAIFMGTPHYGSFLAGDFGAQGTEMHTGSQFLWDLNRWNQDMDDLREVDALAIVGNGALSGKSDGVVEVTSASLAMAGVPPERTRVINACHIDGFAAFAILCSVTQGVASSTESQQIVNSFLADTTQWMSLGQTPAQDPVLSTNAGRYFSVFGADNSPQATTGSMSFGNQVLTQNPDSKIFYSDLLPATTGTLTYTIPGQPPTRSPISITAGGYTPLALKPPPVMVAVRPAAGQIATLNLAPNALISIFGTGLASASMTSSFPWPTSLGDVTVAANGQPLQLLYVGSGQINAYLPDGLSGLVQLQLTNSLGQYSINVMTTDASPAIFSADSSGTGTAAAIHASTGQPVTASNPAMAGEYIELYGTGFGSTHESGGYAVTTLSPTLQIGGAAATVTFCGVPAGGVGLYQINFVVPDGLTAGPLPLSIVLGKHTSNVVTLPVQ